MLITNLLVASLLVGAGIPGDWPEPRQNGHLTGVQPLAGAMREAPAPLAELNLGQSPPTMQIMWSFYHDTHGIGVHNGALYCYSSPGVLDWSIHPRNLNFTSIADMDDFEEPNTHFALLKCARAAEPLGAVALVSLEDGTLLWRYDVEPMSYSWTLHYGDYVPDSPRDEIVVLMQGYPPDPKNGYIAVFGFAPGEKTPHMLWRYDFDAYTCFPSLLQSDLDGDETQEIVVETHSKMWFLDASTGAVKHFVEWDVAPANNRSYGLVKFVDLNLDGLEDFLCIADFAQHHEVLLNKGGKMEKAWGYGWPESVTTGKVETVYPDYPSIYLDDQVGMVVALSMFNSEGEGDWLLRVYDAVTGELKYKRKGAIVQTMRPIAFEQPVGILVDICHEPTRTRLEGVELLNLKNGEWEVVWSDENARALQSKHLTRDIYVEKDGIKQKLLFNADEKKYYLEPVAQEQQKSSYDFSQLPPVVGPGFGELLAADLLGGPEKEVVLYTAPSVNIFYLDGRSAIEPASYTSTCLPVIADLDGDKKNEIVLVDAAPEHTPIVEAKTPSLSDKPLWRTELPKPDRTGLPHARPAYLRTAHFNGLDTPDLYLWAGTPLARSLAINGRTGEVMWEKGEVGGVSERYWGATMNLASAIDFDKDGAEDLVFANPDYYCVASGKTGEFLLGPAFPPAIFSQPSQGLYTFPAILPHGNEEPVVALVAGHYFQAAMSLHAQPMWYALPQPGEARCAVEGFAEIAPGKWVMGFARQNGRFACINMDDGSLRWDLELDGAGTDAIVCDVDGDGKQEFVFGSTHGTLYAVGDGETTARVVWTLDLGAALGAPIAADMDNDGKSEIIVQTAAGRIVVLGGK